MKKLMIFLFIVVASGLALGSGVAYYLFHIPSQIELPAICGAHGKHFEIRCHDDVPVLWSYGLPYPTDVDEDNRRRQSLNGQWKMRLDPDAIGEAEQWDQLEEAPAQWEEVAVPSTFNAAGERHYYQGISWFMLRFTPEFPPEEQEFLRLCFRGVLLRSKVWLNGTLLGSREGGYTPFYFDITPYMEPETHNVLIVKSDNRLRTSSLPPRLSKHHHPAWWPYGGIYRDVYLETLPRHYIFKVMTESELIERTAGLQVTVLTHNMSTFDHDYVLSCSVFDPRGEKVEEHTLHHHHAKPVLHHQMNFHIPTPQLWTEQSPELYTIHITIHPAAGQDIPSDQVEIKTGIRTIAVQENALHVNGEPVFLRGIAKMEDSPTSGATQSSADIASDLALVKEMNANYIRLAHYPHHAEELRQARDAGIMLSGEIPFYHVGMGWVQWYVEHMRLSDFPVETFGLKHLYQEELLLNAQRGLIEMIERDRNNPAIIFWMLSNESYSLFDSAGKIYGWLRDVARAFDDTRPVSCTELIYTLQSVNRLFSSGKYMDILSVNAYYGWYYGQAEDISNYLDHYHQAYPTKPVIVTEFGAGAVRGWTEQDGDWQAERIPPGRTFSEAYQAEVLSTYLHLLPQKEYVIGVAPWVFADFSSYWFPNNPLPYHNCKGLLSKNRQPKQGFSVVKTFYQQLRH